MNKEGQRILVIQEGDTRYGMDSALIEEIIESPSIYPMPGTPQYVQGIMLHKGKVIPVFSLQQLCGIQNRQEPVCIAFSSEKGTMALSVENAEKIMPCPQNTVNHDSIHLNNGILKISKVLPGDNPIFVLDIEKLVQEFFGIFNFIN